MSQEERWLSIEETCSLRHETDNLKKALDILLPKLISGEVTLEEAVNE